MLSLGALNQSCALKFKGKKNPKTFQVDFQEKELVQVICMTSFFFSSEFHKGAVPGAFCWGCVCQGAVPDFPCGFAVTPFLRQPHGR